MDKTEKQAIQNQNDWPSKCMESPLTRFDGGIKSEAAALANQAPHEGADNELDWVDNCPLNQTRQAGPIAGGPESQAAKKKAL